MSELSWMVTITNKVNADKFRALYEKHGASAMLVTYGRGTATSRVLDAFGLEQSEKAILSTTVVNDVFPSIRRELERRFLIDVPGTGIVFLIPMSAVGGKPLLKMMLGEQEFIKREETELKNTEQELIVVIAVQGYADQIMDAARSAKARGGTVIHVKGTGSRGAQKFFGVSLASEREMIYIVVPSGNRDAVMRAIMDQAGLHTEAQAVCFALPVIATAGMRLAVPDDEEAL